MILSLIRNLLAVVGLVIILLFGYGYYKASTVHDGALLKHLSSINIEQIKDLKKFDKKALKLYAKMAKTVLVTGQAAPAMVISRKVLDDVSNDDVQDTIEAIATEYNMRLTGTLKMFTNENAKGTETKHARMFSLCSLSIAKKFLNSYPEYGAFMPCRIILIEKGNGDRHLYTMDLGLMVHGGHKLSPEMFELASLVQKAMTEIPTRAAEGEF